MANKVVIDGIDYTGDVLGVDDFSVTYAKDDSTNSVTVGISSSLAFIRAAYVYLKAKFFDAGISGRDAEAAITITTDCCNDSYDLFIRGDAVTICFDTCKIETAGFERSDDQKAADRIKNYGILRAGQPILTTTSPMISTCLDAGWLTAVNFAVVNVFLSLFGALAALIGNQSLQNQIDALRLRLLGCGRKTRLFYLRAIFEDIALNAGLVPISSFLQNGTYSQSAWMDVMAQTPVGGNGFAGQDLSFLFGSEWLDIVASTFNAEWQIRNGKLYLERKDFFFTLNEVLVDVEQAKADKLAETVCYTFSDVQKFAYGRYEYQNDSGDVISSIVLPDYGDIVEWNIPLDLNKKGVYDKAIPLAPPRFNGDQRSYDEDVNIIVNNRPAGALLVSESRRQARTFPKIIVINPQANNDPDFQNAVPVSIPPPNNEPWFIFNSPMMLREGDPNALYENFFKIDDPRESGSTPYQIDEFEFLANCEQIDKIRTFGLDLIIETRLGQGIAEEIEVNYVTKIVTLKNVKIKV